MTKKGCKQALTALLRAYPNNRVVMRPSEKFEAKAAGQKGSPGVVFSTLRTFFHRQRRHRALQPAAIERVIGIGSKSHILIKLLTEHADEWLLKVKFIDSCERR
ncbi:MAG TPA: hypothetical protein VMW72_18645 [Sedimentisphaerales bacterium]|nr:hypothetical protein [Sedimentisphaerales bacterium]